MTRPGAEPHLFIVMGATGDLVRRKLLPALARLHARGELPDGCVLLGTSRHLDLDDAALEGLVRTWLADSGIDERQAARFLAGTHVRCQVVREGVEPDYRALSERITALESELRLPGNRVYYLALPPGALPATIDGLGGSGLARSPGWTRVVVEKPFGRDLESARGLNELLHRYYDESQVYRIDHYLGKETVQNLLVFRFANPIFESLWNRDRVESVEITVSETIGIGRRASYYEDAGVVRDMVQNHLLQLMALLAMEVPIAFDAQAIRHEKVKVMSAVRPIQASDVVFGQYGAGTVAGEDVPGYLAEEGVSAGSRTPTYVALRLAVDNWRWQGVPFFLRTGKRLSRQVTQVAVTFRRAPVYIFAPYEQCSIHRNVLFLTLQPDEGFALRFEVKAPGSEFRTRTQLLDFGYEDVFGALPDAYETLLMDIVLGEQTLFVRSDEVETAWALCRPILEPAAIVPVHGYAAGTWGPREARSLLADHGGRWQVR